MPTRWSEELYRTLNQLSCSSSLSELSLYSLSCVQAQPGSIDVALHDGTVEIVGGRSVESLFSDSSSSTQRRVFVFGTPTSQAGPADNSPSTDSEVESTYQAVGMDPVRDARGSIVGAHGSVHSVSLLDIPIARGGYGSTPWILLDQPGTVSPEYFGSRRRSPMTSDGTRSQHSGRVMEDYFTIFEEPHSPPAMHELPSPRYSPPIRKERRLSIESKFSEDFPMTRTSSPFKWFKNKIRSKSDSSILHHDTEPEKAGIITRKTLEFRPRPRKLKKRVDGTSTISQGIESSSQLNDSLPEAFLKNFDGQEDNTTPESSFFHTDGASNTEKPKTALKRFRSIVMLAGRRLSAVTPMVVSGAASFDASQQLQVARSQSVPPPDNKKNTVWSLEFLPTEANGVKTPESLPTYDAKNLGGKTMSRSKELKYFGLANMVQSQPPLASAGEPSASLDPLVKPGIVASHSPVLYAYSDSISAIAPFIGQDIQFDSCPRHPKPFYRAILTTGKKIRRASVQAGIFAKHRKLFGVDESPIVHRDPPDSTTNSGKSMSTTRFLEREPISARSKSSVIPWIRKASTDVGLSGSSEKSPRRGKYEADQVILKPVEVLEEEARREKRDTGIIRLDPADAQSSSDDSFTYAAALRDIAGLPKFPQGPAIAADGNLVNDIWELERSQSQEFSSSGIHPESPLWVTNEDIPYIDDMDFVAVGDSSSRFSSSSGCLRGDRNFIGKVDQSGSRTDE